MGVRIGGAAAWSGDRIAPADVLIERGDLDYLMFDSMSEATMSGAQVQRGEDPSLPGYDPWIERRLRPILGRCREHSVRIISNQGWLDPAGGAHKLSTWAREDGVVGMKVASVAASPLFAEARSLGLRIVETGEMLSDRLDDIVSIEPYLGAWEIAGALREGADVVLTSRVTDASLALGPLIHELGWGRSDWDLLARGVVIGHLLECGPQVAGGNIADPGYLDVEGLADLGHPIAEVDSARASISKVAGTGGLVSVETCKAQLLWEVGDPARYVGPDVIADFTDVWFSGTGPDCVEVLGGRGAPPPDSLKALVGVREGFFSEEMVVYAGPGALNRARLAEEILRERLRALGFKPDDMRFDYVGLNSVHREATPPSGGDPYEVVLRLAARARSRSEISKLAEAVAPMAVSGPTGTGKWGTLGNRVRPVVGMYSTFVPKAAVAVTTEFFQS